MGYCFMTFQKIKTPAEMRARYIHNYREKEVSNVDPQKAFLNEELIKLTDEEGKKISYQEAFKRRIQELPYYKDHSVRSNAVLGLEVVTTFSREENIDLEEWKRKNVKWLKDTFDKAGDHKSNVLSVVYHADEPGNRSSGPLPE